MRGMTRGWGARLLVGLLATWGGGSGAVRAESPGWRCDYSWWLPLGPQEITVSGLPERPWVFVPVYWTSTLSPSGEGPAPAYALGRDGLVVEVRDAAGAFVPGELATRGAREPVFRGLEHRLRWRPVAPLVSGAEYVMTVHVAAGPASSNPACWAPEAFTRTVRLEVAAAPLTLPVPTVTSVRTGDAWSDLRLYGLCDGSEGQQACADVPEVCCWWPLLVRSRRVEVEVVADMPTDLADRVGLVVTTDAPRCAGPATTLPVPAGAFRAFFCTDIDFEGRLPEVPAAVCATARTYDLATESYGDAAQLCSDVAAHVAAGAQPELVCEPDRCARVHVPPSPELGPEALAEAGPERPSLGADVWGPDGGDGDDDLGGYGPGAPATPEGCGGGREAFWPLVLALALWRARRGVRPTSRAQR